MWWYSPVCTQYNALKIIIKSYCKYWIACGAELWAAVHTVQQCHLVVVGVGSCWDWVWVNEWKALEGWEDYRWCNEDVLFVVKLEANSLGWVCKAAECHMYWPRLFSLDGGTPAYLTDVSVQCVFISWMKMIISAGEKTSSSLYNTSWSCHFGLLGGCD